MTGLSSDNTYKRETGQSNSRWYLSWENKVFFNDNLYSNINLQTSSDEYFFRDIGNNQFGQTKTSYLPKKFGLTWKNSYFKIDLDLIRYQILNPFSFQEYKSKPSLTIQSFLSKKDLHLSLFINKSKFKLDTINPMRETYKKVDRTYFSPQLTYKKHLPSSSFLVTTGTTYIKHDLDSKEESQSSPWVEMKYSFFLDKDTKTTFKSLIPVLKYIYVKNNSKKQTNLIDSRTISLDYSTLRQKIFLEISLFFFLLRYFSTLFLYLIECHFVLIYIATPANAPRIPAKSALVVPGSMYRRMLSNITFFGNHTINSFFINYTNEEIEVFH